MSATLVLPYPPSEPRAWNAAEDAFLLANYATMKRREIALALGRTPGSVRKRCSVLHLNTKHPPQLTPAEVLRIVQWYQARETDESLRLASLAKELGRTRNLIARKAGQLGLTRRSRPMPNEVRRTIGEKNRARIAEHGHSRGALGLIHSDKTRQRISQTSRTSWADPNSVFNSSAFRQRMSENAVDRALGRLNAGEEMYSRAVHGKRADLDGRYFRSRWEANYARFLNWQVALGAVKEWQYECHTFWFEAITRGTRTYTPDFKVTYPDGRYEWHEVKGWMDAKSKTRLDRMRRYYLQEKLVLIDKEWFAWARKARLPENIPYWEKG